ncbi:MAG: SGNH/GDSL hydrolase family protein [Omnitrophica bacterium]|nr:SGNH/GDSL hydrolase family protein [Candidatus Omnitrophota bacterium]
MAMIVIFSIEIGGRFLYLIKRGRFSHLLAYDAVIGTRRFLPFEPPRANKTAYVKKGDYLVKNGYYTYDPEVSIVVRASRQDEDLPLKRDVPINNLGFRGQYVDISKDDKIRVWCLGGSTTFGYYVKRPYPEALNGFLNANGIRYEVINGGISAFNAQHIYNMLRDKEFVNRVKPDILVVNTYWNTIEQYENNFLIETVDNEFTRNILRSSCLAFFTYRGFLLLKYGEILGPMQAFSVYIDKICRWGVGKKLKIILVNEPMRLDYDAWRAAPEHPKNHAHSSLILKHFEKRYKNKIFFAKLPFFDTIDFSDKKTVNKYFIDRGHRTQAGYLMEAKEIARIIQNL